MRKRSSNLFFSFFIHKYSGDIGFFLVNKLVRFFYGMHHYIFLLSFVSSCTSFSSPQKYEKKGGNEKSQYLLSSENVQITRSMSGIQQKKDFRLLFTQKNIFCWHTGDKNIFPSCFRQYVICFCTQIDFQYFFLQPKKKVI